MIENVVHVAIVLQKYTYLISGSTIITETLIQSADLSSGKYNRFSISDSSSNKCGLKIKHVTLDDHGYWTCIIYQQEDSIQLYNYLFVRSK